MAEEDFNTEDEVLSLINNGTEESLRLEFKSGDSIDKTYDKKVELTKDITAFANSAGGTIIYGVAEAEHRAAAVKPIDGNLFTKEWLEQVIRDNISRPVEGLKIFPVRMGGNIDKSVYVIHIPESEDAPHMALDNRYYCRQNFTVVRMEEYSVRQSYFKATRAKLNLVPLKISPAGSANEGARLRYVKFKVDFSVVNTGRVIENHFKIEIWMPELIPHQVFVGTTSVQSMPRKELVHSVFSVANLSPLFPDEETVVVSAIIEVTKGAFFHIQSTPLTYKLYFSGGKKSEEVLLGPKLWYGDKYLSLDMFA